MSHKSRIARETLLLFLTVIMTVFFAGGMNNALAVPITGNETELTLSPSILSRLELNTIGTAEMNDRDWLSRQVIVFPISGGDTVGVNGGPFIQHEGSGLNLARNGSTLVLDDFTIDKGSNTLFGDALIQRSGADPIALEDVALFDIYDCRRLTYINVNPTSANAFTQAFGTRDRTGDLFGFALIDIQTQPQSVPEPGTLILLGAGILGLLGFRKMK